MCIAKERGSQYYGKNANHASDRGLVCKIYKEQYGVSLNRYISEKRITEAKRLLRFSNMTMEQIGDKVGYEDGNYFSRVFKKLEGCSPREYRKNW